MTDVGERAHAEVAAMIAESALTEIDAVAEIMLVRAWLKGYAASEESHIRSLDRIAGVIDR